MQEGALSLDKSRRDLEKKVEKYACETLNEVEEKSKMLSTTMGNFTNIQLVGTEIENDIINFKKQIKTIDPSQITFTKMGKFSLFNPGKNYFKKLKREEAELGLIVDDLKRKRNILVNDNITLGIEIDRIEEIIEKLEKEYQNGIELKEDILKIVEAAKVKDEEEANFHGNNILQPLEKKLYNIKEMVVVKRQSALALEIIRKNNKEVIENIDRIKNVTTVALKTAIMVANSLYNQKLALKNINFLEVGTESLMDTTSKIVKENYEKVALSGSAEGKVEIMKKTFENIFSTLNEAEIKNKEVIPESQTQILELKKGE